MFNPADAEEFIDATPVDFHPHDEGCDFEDEFDDECDFEDDDYDGQPDEYTEWQDYMGGDDWDHGQYDEY